MTAAWQSDWTCQQTIALPFENIFCEVVRAGAWHPFNRLAGEYSDGWQSARSLGFICPVCCKLWGIIGFPLSPPEADELEFHASCCLEHLGKSRHSRRRVDGSLLLWYSTPEYGDYDIALLNALPRALLERELRVHLAHYEKELEV
jgi:hypothetical protein